MTDWLLQKVYYNDSYGSSDTSSPDNTPSLGKKADKLENILSADVDETFERLKANDMFTNWFRQSTDVSGRMMARIQNFAESISGRVGWSFIIDPGRPRTDLSVCALIHIV